MNVCQELSWIHNSFTYDLAANQLGIAGTLQEPYQNKRVTPHTKITVIKVAGGLIHPITTTYSRHYKIFSLKL